MARARKDRRTLAHKAVKEARRRLRFAEQDWGGSPERAIVVATSHLVEPMAKERPCAACGYPVRVLEHLAETIEGRAVRVAVVRCSRCNVVRRVYFSLEAHVVN